MSSAPAPRSGGPHLHLPGRLAVLVLAAGACLEYMYRRALADDLAGAAFLIVRAAWPALRAYEGLRIAALDHPALAATLTVAIAALTIVAYRSALVLWRNQIRTRLSGNHFERSPGKFPSRKVDVLREIARRPPGSIFVGLQPTLRLLGLLWTYKPLYLTQRQRTMHAQVIGKTGSGKTMSVAFVGALQDVLDRKGLIVVTGKGSDEEIHIVKALAQLGRRTEQLRILALPAWNRPEIFSHTYNIVYVRPRSPGDPGGDPVTTSQRVFSALPLGDEVYYNTQAELLFTNLFRLLHGIVDQQGRGIPFVLSDLGVCIDGIGASDAWGRALDYCLRTSLDRDAARNIGAQIRSLGRDVGKCLSGLRGAIAKFDSPLVNAYDPDIIFEEVLQQDLLVYVQLPANLFPIQAKTLGRVVLQDIQQEGSLRQVFRASRNQNPCAVYLDEFYTFANLQMIDSLNKLRDAHVEYTLLHQTLADLQLTSREFATSVWDNARTKLVLAQDNPELCEQLAKSIGTVQSLEHTARYEPGPYATSLATGDVSAKLVESYRLHPNQIKNLATAGQGYLYTGEAITPVVLGMLPPGLVADYALPRKDQGAARGLRLYERFITPATAGALAAVATSEPLPFLADNG